METIKLDIPKPSSELQSAAITQPAMLKSWLDDLPLGDPTGTVQQLHDHLALINRIPLPVQTRYALLSMFRSPVGEATEPVRKIYMHAFLPLPEKLMLMSTQVRQLTTEMAYGYKIIVMDILASVERGEKIRNLLFQSIYFAIIDLSQLLVEAYGVYGPEPKQVWSEIHELYVFAEKQKLQALPLPHEALKSDVPQSIEHAYRKIMLLSLANPYHLMQGEIMEVYHELDAWASLCKIMPLTGSAVPKSSHYVDMAHRHILDVAPIVKLLNDRLHEMNRAPKPGETAHNNLANRRRRNRYKRLAEAWGIRGERLSQRTPHASEVALIAGIGACHHFIGGREMADVFHVVSGRQKDQSQGGMAVVCQNLNKVQLRVGEIIGFKSNSVSADHWSIGTLRWLRTGTKQTVEFGVRKLAENAMAVTVQGVKGVGQGGEYLHALIAPALDPRGHATTLIVPAAIYDTDSIVLINTGTDLIYAHLEKLLEATDSYARFRFSAVDEPVTPPPDTEPRPMEKTTG